MFNVQSTVGVAGKPFGNRHRPPLTTNADANADIKTDTDTVVRKLKVADSPFVCSSPPNLVVLTLSGQRGKMGKKSILFSFKRR